MKEITRIYTCEITNITVVPDDTKIKVPFPEFLQQQIASYFKDVLEMDDVVIVKTQTFVREALRILSEEG